jgi:hypothetical protein
MGKIFFAMLIVALTSIFSFAQENNAKFDNYVWAGELDLLY